MYSSGENMGNFVIGWHPLDSQKRTYHQVLYESWHEAERIRVSLQRDQPGYVFFVDVATDTKACIECKGTGFDEIGEACGACHGVGRIKA